MCGSQAPLCVWKMHCTRAYIVFVLVSKQGLGYSNETHCILREKNSSLNLKEYLELNAMYCVCAYLFHIHEEYLGYTKRNNIALLHYENPFFINLCIDCLCLLAYNSSHNNLIQQHHLHQHNFHNVRLKFGCLTS